MHLQRPRPVRDSRASEVARRRTAAVSMCELVARRGHTVPLSTDSSLPPSRALTDPLPPTRTEVLRYSVSEPIVLITVHLYLQ